MFRFQRLTWLGLLMAASAEGAWPFHAKEASASKFEGLINVGALGLQGVSGTLAAFGDWNGDQSTDVFTLSADKRNMQIYLWNHKQAKFRPSHNITTDKAIESVVPLDFNLDGHLDVMILTHDEVEDGGWWGTKRGILNAKVYLGGGETGGFQDNPISMSSLTTLQPTIIDATGRLRADFLAVSSEFVSGVPKLQLYRNDLTGFNKSDLPFDQPDKVCTLAEPHSNAFIDLDGDCLSDIFLTCQSLGGTNERSFQVWRNRKNLGYEFAGEWNLPDGAGAISFADMDRDGTIDLVFPTCASHSTSSGIGKDCSINIAYNKQRPLCSATTSTWLHFGQTTFNASRKAGCRSLDELCVADPTFGFDFDPKGDSFTSIPISSLLPGTSSLLFSQPSRKSKSSPYIPLRIGDFNNDGFPDLLAAIVNSTAAPPEAGIFGGPRSTGVQIKLLQNVACGKKDKVEGGLCEGGKLAARRRKLSAVSGAVTDALANIWDARGAAWLDVDENGTLDIVVIRSGKQDGEKITFIKNNIFHDAFFLKAVVLNGACGDECEPLQGGPRYSPYGGTLPGATFKFTTMTAQGRRVPSQVSQLSQTSYLALQTPYSYFGLGRTNNYVENLFVGTSLHSNVHYTNVEGVIPNSYVVLIPPSPEAGNNTLLVKPNEEWHKSLFLHPGDWIGWVIMVVIVVVIILGGVIYLLHMNEKREDELERRKTMHRINFQAL